MKTSINLLPKKLRKSIQHNMRLRVLMMQSFLWIIIPLGIIVMLWAMLVATNIGRDGLSVVNASMEQNYDLSALAQDEKVFRMTNAKLRKVANLSKKSPTPSRIIIQIAQNFPPNTRLDKIEINNSNMEIIGTGLDRLAVLALKENLEQVDCFKDVETPLASIIQKDDVVFTISFQITKKCL